MTKPTNPTEEKRMSQEEKKGQGAAQVKRPQQFGIPKIGISGTGTYTPPPEIPMTEKEAPDGR